MKAWATRLTGEGRGAIAVIRVWGPDAIAVVDRAFKVARGASLTHTPVGRLRFGRMAGPIGDEAVAVILSQDPPEVEIYGHGGSAVTAMTMAALTREGAREVASEAEVSPLSLEKKAEIALSECSTLRTAEILIDQSQGTLRRELEDLDHALAREDSGSLRLIDGLISRGRVGVRLRRGWRVVLTGRPNVGKSRLLNALAGFDRAIVSETAGTTRDVVTCRTALRGWPVELADTAGMRSSIDPIETAGMAMARDRLAQADQVIVVLDRSEPLSPEDEACLAEWPDAIAVANKADLSCAWEIGHRAVMPASAATGEGIDALVEAIAQRLVPEPPAAGAGVPFLEETLMQLETLRRVIHSGEWGLARESLASLRD